MGLTKRYIDFDDSTSRVRYALEQLSKISYSTFIYDSIDDLEISELQYGMEIKELLERDLMELFIRKDLSNTPILIFYRDLDNNAVLPPETSSSTFSRYYGGDLEELLGILSNMNYEPLSSALEQDYIYGECSGFSLIKTAMLAWYRLNRAIQVSLQRQGDSVLISRLKKLQKYIVEQVQVTSLDSILFEWQPNVVQFDLLLEVEEGLRGELRIFPVYANGEKGSSEKGENVFKAIEDLRENIRSKMLDLGINKEDLEPYYTIPSVGRNGRNV